jgi:hypothetical protein
MSVLRVPARGDDEQDAVDIFLLALRGMRRDLESRPRAHRIGRPHAPLVAPSPARFEVLEGPFITPHISFLSP